MNHFHSLGNCKLYTDPFATADYNNASASLEKDIEATWDDVFMKSLCHSCKYGGKNKEENGR